MERLKEIEKEIQTLIDEAEEICLSKPHTDKVICTTYMLSSLRRKTTEVFINVFNYLKNDRSDLATIHQETKDNPT